jgi:hypothetical protein
MDKSWYLKSQEATLTFVTGGDLSLHLEPLGNTALHKLFWERINYLNGLQKSGGNARKLYFGEAIGPAKLSEIPLVSDALNDRVDPKSDRERVFLSRFARDQYRGLRIASVKSRDDLAYTLVLGVSRREIVVLLLTVDEFNTRVQRAPTWKILIDEEDSIDVMTLPDRTDGRSLAYKGHVSITGQISSYVRTLRERFESWESIEEHFRAESEALRQVTR